MVSDYKWAQDDRNVSNYTVEMVVYLCKYTKIQLVIHLRWVDFMVGKLSLNKAVKNFIFSMIS